MTPRDRLNFLYSEAKRLEDERESIGKRLFEIDGELIGLYDEITYLMKDYSPPSKSKATEAEESQRKADYARCEMEDAWQHLW